MKIRILDLNEGAAEARGLTVIIDVFRAFTLEPVLFANGARQVIATAEESEARRLKENNPEYILIGERDGKILPGFDYGNAPSAVINKSFRDKTIIHTTTNGTQGLAHAVHADEIITGALVNAGAVAKYIEERNPEEVSLVAMGWEGKKTEEDILCAEYISSLLNHNEMKDIKKRADDLRYTEGKKFFDPARQSVFPMADFDICTSINIYDFVIRCQRHGKDFIMQKHDETVATDTFG